MKILEKMWKSSAPGSRGGRSQGEEEQFMSEPGVSRIFIHSMKAWSAASMCLRRDMTHGNPTIE